MKSKSDERDVVQRQMNIGACIRHSSGIGLRISLQEAVQTVRLKAGQLTDPLFKDMGSSSLSAYEILIRFAEVR